MDKLKKLLLIAYYFPPDNAVGGLRIAKFARYLPSYGWEPTVLTVEDRYREQFDKKRMNDLGNIKIIKTVKVIKLNDILLAIKRMAAAMLPVPKKKDLTKSEDVYSENVEQIRSETYLQKLKRYYVSFHLLPDLERNWVIPASVRAVTEIMRRRFDAMMTSSPPHSSHIIGLIAKKLTKITWIADFRDPWIDILQNRSPRIRSKLTDKIERCLEKLVIHNADKIITTTDEHRKAIMARFPGEPQCKFVYIPNGIDTDKFNTGPIPERYDEFTISYVGTIYLKRTPEPIFKAIQHLVSSGRIRPSEIRFKLFGHCELIDGKPIDHVIKSYGLESIVEVSKPIPFMDAINVMQRSHLLVLLVTPVQDINIPAKIYDYFGSGTKIIAITEGGAASTMINETKSGECFKPTDITGIAEYILDLMKNPNRDQLRNNPSLYAHYDTKLLTGKLAQLLSTSTGIID